MANRIVSDSSESLASSNLLKHPAFGSAPVKNIRSPGRKKGTASLAAARYKRWLASQPPANPDPAPVVVPPIERGNFNYPKEMLTQAYFCLAGNGTWHVPSMNMGMLVHENFVSPIGKLLDQLEAEGNNVSGARAEWLAFRELAKGIDEEVELLQRQLHRLVLRRPVAASILVDDAEC